MAVSKAKFSGRGVGMLPLNSTWCPLWISTLSGLAYICYINETPFPGGNDDVLLWHVPCWTAVWTLVTQVCYMIWPDDQTRYPIGSEEGFAWYETVMPMIYQAVWLLYLELRLLAVFWREGFSYFDYFEATIGQTTGGYANWDFGGLALASGCGYMFCGILFHSPWPLHLAHHVGCLIGFTGALRSQGYAHLAAGIIILELGSASLNSWEMNRKSTLYFANYVFWMLFSNAWGCLSVAYWCYEMCYDAELGMIWCHVIITVALYGIVLPRSVIFKNTALAHIRSTKLSYND